MNKKHLLAVALSVFSGAALLTVSLNAAGSSYAEIDAAYKKVNDSLPSSVQNPSSSEELVIPRDADDEWMIDPKNVPDPSKIIHLTLGRLSNTKITGKYFDRFENIMYLDMQMCPNVAEENVGKLKKLLVLKADNPQLTGKFIPQLENLVILNVAGTSVNDENLSKLKNIKYLGLVGCKKVTGKHNGEIYLDKLPGLTLITTCEDQLSENIIETLKAKNVAIHFSPECDLYR